MLDLQHRVYVIQNGKWWQVQTLFTSWSNVFSSKQDALQFAYEFALEYDYTIHIVNQDGTITIRDPDDDMDYDVLLNPPSTSDDKKTRLGRDILTDLSNKNA